MKSVGMFYRWFSFQGCFISLFLTVLLSYDFLKIYYLFIYLIGRLETNDMNCLVGCFST